MNRTDRKYLIAGAAAIAQLSIANEWIIGGGIWTADRGGGSHRNAAGCFRVGVGPRLGGRLLELVGAYGQVIPLADRPSIG